MAKFERQLPEGLDLIARSLRAGHAFTLGMRMAADEYDDPLGPELKLALDEINFGISVEEALKDLAERIDCPDLRYFIVSVILQRETGGNLAEILENISSLIRERFKFRGKVKALSAEGKLSAIILLALPFFVFLALRFTSPEYIETLFTDPIGKSQRRGGSLPDAARHPGHEEDHQHQAVGGETAMPRVSPLVIAGLAFLAFCLFFLGVVQYRRYRAGRKKLLAMVRGEPGEFLPAAGDSPWSPGHGALPGRAAGFLAAVGERFAPRRQERQAVVHLKFLRAGLRYAHISHVFWGAKILLLGLLPLLFFTFRLSVLEVFNPSLVLAVCLFLGLLGFNLPDLWLRLKTAKRKELFQEALPDALDLLVVCVEAGMGLNAAFNRVGEEMRFRSRPIYEELRHLSLELMAGKPREEAFRNLAARIDLEDLRNLVTLLIQTERFGTSVTKALRVYSDTFRTRRYQRAEELAAKMPVKLVFPLILFIFPSLFVAIAGPAAIRLYRVVILGS